MKGENPGFVFKSKKRERVLSTSLEDEKRK